MKKQSVFLLLLLCLAGSHLTAWGVLAQSPTIEIIQPLDRRNISDENAIVQVQIAGVMAKDGHYWELWVDQEPVVGARNGEDSVTVSFDPTGPHRLQAILFDAQGKQLAASNLILVIAAPIDEREPQFNQKQMAPIMASFTLVVIGVIVGSVWLSRRSRTARQQPIETHQ